MPQRSANFGIGTLGADDTAVIDLAARERRIFVTEDRDFGQLVYAAAKPASGVILLRFPSAARAALPATLVDFVTKHGEKLGDRFVVLQPGRIRLDWRLLRCARDTRRDRVLVKSIRQLKPHLFGSA